MLRQGMRCQVVVPATSANLGVGFDCLGMALELEATFAFEPAAELEILGCEERFRGEDNLVWQSYLEAARQLDVQPVPLRITIDSPIPLSGGLGSSSACVVAGIAAAQVVHDHAIDPYLTLRVATSIEGHPDNVAPAILGGVVSSFIKDGETTSVRDNVSEQLRFVAVAPPIEIRTEEARAALEALRWGDLALLGKACDDRLHEPFRKKLIPCYDEVRAVALGAGAGAFFISGSGSTMIAVCNSDELAERVAVAERASQPDAWVRVLRASDQGVRAAILD